MGNSKIEELYRLATSGKIEPDLILLAKAPDDILVEIERLAAAAGVWCAADGTRWDELDVCCESLGGAVVAPLLQLLTPFRLISIVRELRNYRAGGTGDG